MDGTRQDTFSKFDEWLNNFDAPNIFWIKGYPGAGKSAIASSLVERLVQSRRLGASFFFQRDNAAMATTNALWRMLAFELSQRHPGVRKSLVAKLRANEIQPTTVNADSLFQQCIFDALVASGDIPTGRLPVIVVDALDECGGLEGQNSAQRKALMKSLDGWSKLPNKFKLVVTSRDETDIEQTFNTTIHVALLVSMGDADIHPSNDIRTYFKREFRRIVSDDKSLSDEWPGESTIDSLTERAAGLFIWAKTVIRFIEMGSPKSQLERISEGGGFDDLNHLYSRVLEIAFPTPNVKYTDAARSILATAILTKTPLPASAITKFLNIEKDVMEYVFRRMRSVLDTKALLRIRHYSLKDFLLNEKACPPAFHIKLDHWNQALTLACLNTMKSGLKFNICGLESSYIRNSDVPNLESRVETCIHPEISYSCLFWTEHLSKSHNNDELHSGIQDFLDNRFLYWLEVLSLCKRMNQTSGILKLLIDWMIVSWIMSIPHDNCKMTRSTGKQAGQLVRLGYAAFRACIRGCNSGERTTHLSVCTTSSSSQLGCIAQVFRALSAGTKSGERWAGKLASNAEATIRTHGAS
jgi:hypothetical protein